ncbi:pyrophosphorylase [Microlunatus soli]|uniref:Pyrophosphorylase n=1 Tax=Microlunatus soli TaxID=630515 RepID=A0A1H1XC70_9ACTN|nr:pyrophosphorylase [Microlunatus soli]SDT06867.1 hypothetical protein SAMN04489812_4020 [Microlunatus soli]
MGDPRVLTTQGAKDAIRAIENIINHGLTQQIQSLDSQGKKLSDPNVWDGPLATQFRTSTWPETHSALNKAKTELEDLKRELSKISTDIMTAGGGH